MALDSDNPVVLASVTELEAQAVLAADAAAGAMCSEGEAVDFARLLVGYYPAREFNSPDIFVRGLTAIFMAFPRYMVRRVIDPVNGIASRESFLDLVKAKTALDAEMAKRNRIVGNAAAVLKRHGERRAAAEEARRIEKGRGDAVRRAAHVAALLRQTGESLCGQEAGNATQAASAI